MKKAMRPQPTSIEITIYQLSTIQPRISAFSRAEKGSIFFAAVHSEMQLSPASSHVSSQYP